MIFAVFSVMLSLLKSTLQYALPPITGTAALAIFLAAPADARQPIETTNTLCATAIQAEERRSGIPKRLLAAIASVESGRWQKSLQANIAWPWTVTAEGEGKFYPSKDAAIRAVETLRYRGISNIDVGCMQINLGYHPDAFASLREAFNPAVNVAYAARFLKELRVKRRSWDKAIRFYHSSDPARQRYYGNKVYKARRDIQRRDAKQRRSARLSVAEARRTTTTLQNNAAAAKTPLSQWPPRGYRAQRQLELRARNWAFNKRRH